MTLAEYYNGPFASDLARVLRALPPIHQHEPGEVTLQPRSLSLANPTVRHWPRERRGLFASALFLTILADQVCYTHFREHYWSFRDLTMYPKFRGDCPGACYYHVDPSIIFRSVGCSEGRLRAPDELNDISFPADLWPTMEHEVVSFFSEHLPSVDGRAFWLRCWSEVPVSLKIQSGAFGGDDAQNPRVEPGWAT